MCTQIRMHYACVLSVSIQINGHTVRDLGQRGVLTKVQSVFRTGHCICYRFPSHESHEIFVMLLFAGRSAAASAIINPVRQIILRQNYIKTKCNNNTRFLRRVRGGDEKHVFRELFTFQSRNPNRPEIDTATYVLCATSHITYCTILWRRVEMREKEAAAIVPTVTRTFSLQKIR